MGASEEREKLVGRLMDGWIDRRIGRHKHKYIDGKKIR